MSILSEVSPSQQRGAQVKLELKDAEEVGSDQWRQQEKRNEYHQGKCNYPFRLILASIKCQVTGTVLG